MPSESEGPGPSSDSREADSGSAESSDLAPGLESLVSELEGAAGAEARLSPTELIRAIGALGFDIVRREPTGSGATGELRDSVAAAEALLANGEALLAFEKSSAALERWPGALRLQQLRGLALARGGSTRRANELLRALRDEGHQDGETLGLLARTHKDLAMTASTPGARQEQLERALSAYQDGYDAALRASDVDSALFTGVNAATVSLLLGESGRAAELAREVSVLGREQLEHCADAPSYWLHATLGEAALLLGEREEAAQQYRLASGLAATQFANLSSTRAQARRVLESRCEESDWLDEILQIPPVAVFTGHMIDHPERSSPRFPATAESGVAAAIGEMLDRRCPSALYSSAACGGDILFLEAARERGFEYHVVLPLPPETFARGSVDFADSGTEERSWRSRFDAVLEGAASVTTTSDHQASGSSSVYVYANLVLDGMAALHASSLGTERIGMAVWDGEPGGAAGGAASVVEHWQSRGLTVESIDPSRPTPRSRQDLRTSNFEMTRAESAEREEASLRLRAMLFADAVGYSKLSENQIPLFVDRFLAPIARLIEDSGASPILKESAGDGLYFVFENVREAGIFALALRDLIAGVDWEAEGLPASMALRVALHCGPVHSIQDPITGQRKYTGPHTSRAARIEPITPPGQVYASQAFAALSAAFGNTEFTFDYVGRTALAKKYGSLGLYHVRRADG